MGRKTRDPETFIESVKQHNPKCVYVDRHWWGYHVWFVPSGYKFEDRLIIDGKESLEYLLRVLSELTEMKVTYLIVKDD